MNNKTKVKTINTTTITEQIELTDAERFMAHFMGCYTVEIDATQKRCNTKVGLHQKCYEQLKIAGVALEVFIDDQNEKKVVQDD